MLVHILAVIVVTWLGRRGCFSSPSNTRMLEIFLGESSLAKIFESFVCMLIFLLFDNFFIIRDDLIPSFFDMTTTGDTHVFALAAFEAILFLKLFQFALYYSKAGMRVC